MGGGQIAGRLVGLRGAVPPGAPLATCPECSAELDIDEFDVDRGDLLSCPECNQGLAVTSLSPLELEAALEDEADSTDEEEEDDDEGGADDDGDLDDE